MRSRGGRLMPCRSAADLAVDTLMFALPLEMLLTGQYLQVLPVSAIQSSAHDSRLPPLPGVRAMCDRELTLTELLDDPMTQAVMAADRVDPAELKAVLAVLAHRLQPTRPAQPVRDYVGRGERSW